MHCDRILMTVMTSSSLPGVFLLLLLSSTVSGLGSVVTRRYTHFKMHYTWQQAQTYCRNAEGQHDLATLYTQSESENIYLEEYHAWIGLYKDKDSQPWKEDWTWISGRSLDYDKWSDGEPNDGEKCGYAYFGYNDDERIGSDACEKYFFFICHKSKFIPESKTYDEAHVYCHSEYNCLAEFHDADNLRKEVDPEDFPVWIGLHRLGETWKWSTGLSDYRNWASDEPGNNGDCVSISSMNKKMATRDCSHRFPFICYKDNLVLVKENKTWEEALEHCRALRSPTNAALRYELVSVQPEDYNHVMNKVKEANTEEVWTGLRFLAGEWLWVNKADMMYSDLPLCPPVLHKCGALSKNGTGSMETRDCAERKNFMCYSKEDPLT